MATDPTHDDARMSDLAVLEANEYKQRRRLERILDARDGVEEAADIAWDKYVRGEIGREARNITIQRAVKKFIREVYKLLLDYHKEAMQDGDGGGLDRYWTGTGKDPIGEIRIGDERVAVIDGLEDFLESKQFYTKTYTETTSRRNMPPEEVTRRVEVTVPVEASHRAGLRVVEFLDDVHDMEISFEAVERDAHGDVW